MSILRIASRYAKSLFDLAKEQGVLDSVHEDIMYVWEVAKHDEFADFLKNPLVSKTKKKKVFEAVFTSKVSKLTINTLMVLAEHRRERYLRDLCRVFHAAYNKEKHVSSAKLITAEAISDSMVDQILSEFKQSGLLEADVELEKEIDPSIVGGFILEFNDQVYNASIAYQLDQLRTEFSENLYIKNF